METLSGLETGRRDCHSAAPPAGKIDLLEPTVGDPLCQGDFRRGRSNNFTLGRSCLSLV